MDRDEVVGGPALDRQERPIRLDATGRPLVPQRVPEVSPTPLTEWFIYLSVVVLVCGVVAIMALELGTPVSSPLVKVPVLIGGLAPARGERRRARPRRSLRPRVDAGRPGKGVVPGRLGGRARGLARPRRRDRPVVVTA